MAKKNESQASETGETKTTEQAPVKWLGPAGFTIYLNSAQGIDAGAKVVFDDNTGEAMADARVNAGLEMYAAQFPGKIAPAPADDSEVNDG